MRNFLKETIDVLKYNHKKPKDILWIGIPETGYINWEKFIKLADIEYNNGYGSPEINTCLIIVGKNWWLERHQYDGSEWWEFKTLPKKPNKNVESIQIKQ